MRRPAALLAALLSSALLGCATPFWSEPSSEPGSELDSGGAADASCQPAFPYRDGWLGGDAAYSVPLSKSRSLWLFGDTFVGRPDQPDRVGATLVHNSVAVSECGREGRFSIRYLWGEGPGGAPTAFLERDGSDGWSWLFDGVTHGDSLYLGVLHVEPSAPHGPLRMPFRYSGASLGRVSDFGRPAEDWTVELLPLSHSTRALPLSALAVDDAYLYLFTFWDLGDGRYPRSLCRLALAALDAGARDLSGHLEYLARDGTWKPGLGEGDARIVMDDNATEMSVRYHAGVGRWLALYNYPDVPRDFPRARASDAVYVRSAERIEGPWSAPRLLFRIPELAADASGDPNTACYAAKEQEQFSGPDALSVTYVCNLFTGPGEDPYAVLGRLSRAMELYRPAAVSVPLPHDL